MKTPWEHYSLLVKDLLADPVLEPERSHQGQAEEQKSIDLGVQQVLSPNCCGALRRSLSHFLIFVLLFEK